MLGNEVHYVSERVQFTGLLCESVEHLLVSDGRCIVRMSEISDRGCGLLDSVWPLHRSTTKVLFNVLMATTRTTCDYHR